MRRALGKGLSQLLGEHADSGIQEVPVSSISPNPNQPRKEFEPNALAELADSIARVGLMQPIVVREIGPGKYQIIAGERRWRASQLAELTTVPVSIRSANDADAMQLALIENIQREDISPLELAEAYAGLIDAHGLSQETLASLIGKSRPTIANTLRLLKLPAEILDWLRQGFITEGHARALLQFETDAERLFVFRRILDERMTVRDVERLAKRGISIKAKRAEAADAISTSLSEVMGAPTRIVRKGRGGKIEIDFFGDDDLQRLIEKLQG
jgi:ParB family chromosome partitioning protein